MTKDEALALCDYLECNDASMEAQCEAAAFIREALAQPEQEPVKVAHRHEWFRTNEMKVGEMRCISCGVWGHEGKPQRTWIGLTVDEFEHIELGCRSTPFGKIEAMQQVEAKLKEKNT